MNIPPEFYNVNYNPVHCETVGEVIEQLKRLPPDLPVDQGFGKGVRITVYNASTDPHVEFDEVD